jgi:hypothetical protein
LIEFESDPPQPTTHTHAYRTCVCVRGSGEGDIEREIEMSIQAIKKQYPDLYWQIWEKGLKAAKNRQYVEKRKARIQESDLILF